MAKCDMRVLVPVEVRALLLVIVMDVCYSVLHDIHALNDCERKERQAENTAVAFHAGLI